MRHHLTPANSFQLLDEIIAQHNVKLLSLNPQKKITTSFAELGNLIVETTTDLLLIAKVRDTLEHILHAQLQNFPQNIFWDFDFVVSSMLRQALAAGDRAIDFLESFGNKMVSLSELFGIKTEIRFRYVHDFIYGFEWARWVQKQPETRAHLEPFSLVFLDYLLVKGKEILQRISHGQNITYKLCDTGFRNPFTFSREPEDERLLLSCLAGEELIPVATWNWDAQPVWNKPYQDMRQQLALKLDIKPQSRN